MLNGSECKIEDMSNLIRLVCQTVQGYMEETPSTNIGLFRTENGLMVQYVEIPTNIFFSTDEKYKQDSFAPDKTRLNQIQLLPGSTSFFSKVVYLTDQLLHDCFKYLLDKAPEDDTNPPSTATSLRILKVNKQEVCPTIRNGLSSFLNRSSISLWENRSRFARNVDALSYILSSDEDAMLEDQQYEVEGVFSTLAITGAVFSGIAIGVGAAVLGRYLYDKWHAKVPSTDVRGVDVEQPIFHKSTQQVMI